MLQLKYFMRNILTNFIKLSNGSLLFHFMNIWNYIKCSLLKSAVLNKIFTVLIIKLNIGTSAKYRFTLDQNKFSSTTPHFSHQVYALHYSTTSSVQLKSIDRARSHCTREVSDSILYEFVKHRVESVFKV